MQSVSLSLSLSLPRAHKPTPRSRREGTLRPFTREEAKTRLDDCDLRTHSHACGVLSNRLVEAKRKKSHDDSHTARVPPASKRLARARAHTRASASASASLVRLRVNLSRIACWSVHSHRSALHRETHLSGIVLVLLSLSLSLFHPCLKSRIHISRGDHIAVDAPRSRRCKFATCRCIARCNQARCHCLAVMAREGNRIRLRYLRRTRRVKETSLVGRWIV